MVAAFCSAAGLAASEVAVVGDAIHDMEMGARAGVGLKVAVLSGTSARADLAAHADLVLDSLRDLDGALRQLT